MGGACVTVPHNVPPQAYTWYHVRPLVRPRDTTKTPEITTQTDAVLRETIGYKYDLPQLLTGGLLVRVQPEEPNLVFRRFWPALGRCGGRRHRRSCK